MIGRTDVVSAVFGRLAAIQRKWRHREESSRFVTDSIDSKAGLASRCAGPGHHERSPRHYRFPHIRWESTELLATPPPVVVSYGLSRGENFVRGQKFPASSFRRQRAVLQHGAALYSAVALGSATKTYQRYLRRVCLGLSRADKTAARTPALLSRRPSKFSAERSYKLRLYAGVTRGVMQNVWPRICQRRWHCRP